MSALKSIRRVFAVLIMIIAVVLIVAAITSWGDVSVFEVMDSNGVLQSTAFGEFLTKVGAGFLVGKGPMEILLIAGILMVGAFIVDAEAATDVLNAVGDAAAGVVKGVVSMASKVAEGVADGLGLGGFLTLALVGGGIYLLASDSGSSVEVKNVREE